MEVTDAFAAASDEFMRRCRRVTSDQWQHATPCSDWDVRALVNHVAGEWLWVTELMSGKTVADVGDRLNGDVLGDDPVAAAQRARDSAAAAFAAAGAMQQTVHLSFGDVPGSDYCTQMAVDSVIHTWDLATAIGAETKLEDGLVQFAFDYLSREAENWRAGGAFAAAKEPADDSLQAQLIALTGR